MPLIRIKYKDYEQLFLKSGSVAPDPNFLDVSACPVLKDYIPSLVLALPERRAILKLVRARRWHEYVKLLWNHSRASKEIAGNRLLRSIGICVPHIHESGMGLFPAKGYQFLGYYIMDDLQYSGFENSRFLFLEGRVTEVQRGPFLQNILGDIHRMCARRIVFNDLKFENIFCNAQGDIAWIDTGISYYPYWQRSKFRKKHNDAIDYFLLHHEKFLRADEVVQFKSLYLGETS